MKYALLYTEKNLSGAFGGGGGGQESEQRGHLFDADSDEKAGVIAQEKWDKMLESGRWTMFAPEFQVLSRVRPVKWKPKLPRKQTTRQVKKKKGE